MSELYFADLSDSSLATKAVDLNGLYNGDTYGFALREIHWGDIDTEVTWQSDGEVPGAEQTRKHHPVVEANIRIHADFSEIDYATYLETIRLLGAYLDSYGVLVWHPDGIDDPLYIDTYPSPVPALFRGVERQGVFVVDGLQDPAAYEFTVWHHPHPRGASVVIASSVGLDNSVGGNVLTYDNPGTTISEGRLTIEVPGSEDVVQVRVGLRSGDVTEYAASFTNYTISGASSVDDFWKLIDTQTLTPSDPAALAGTYRMLASLTLADDVFFVQARWGWATTGPAANTNDAIQLDADELTSFAEVEVDLGLVTFDEGSNQLVLEIWARSEGGADMGGWGTVTLIPADEQLMTYSVPGFRSGRYGVERFDGEELEASSVDIEFNDDGAAILEELNEAVEVKPTSGRALEAGRHVFGFWGNVRNKNRTKAKVGELQVLTSGGSPVEKIVLRGIKGHSVTWANEFARRFVSIDTAGASYRVRAIHTEATVVGRHIKVGSIRHWYIPVVTGGRAMVVDTGDRFARVVDGSGDRIFSLKATGYPYIPPGEGALVFTIGTLAPNGHDGVDYREPLPGLESGTGISVTLEVTPRHLHP